MRRLILRAALPAAFLGFLGSFAQAQYRYPGGYGGWGGWGAASTVGGSHAQGMGVFAAGAGAYNEQTAEARSINAQTSMQMSSYIRANQQQRDREYYQNQAIQSKKVNEAGDQIYQRIHDHPEPHDIQTGDALNAVMNDLTDPANYGNVLQAATKQIPSDWVKNIPFNYAIQAITISLDNLTAQGAPDALLTNPAFASDRTAIRALAQQARKESNTQGSVAPETLARLRTAIKAVETKVPGVFPDGSTQRTESMNYLKALYGFTRMLQTPNIAAFLKGLDKVPTVSLGQLIGFMHSLNLRFGVAQQGPQLDVYDQLYSLLAGLRNQVAPPNGAPATLAGPPPDPKAATQYFSGMHMNHFNPQPDPHTGQVPAAPQPGSP